MPGLGGEGVKEWQIKQRTKQQTPQAKRPNVINNKPTTAIVKTHTTAKQNIETLLKLIQTYKLHKQEFSE